MLSPSVSLKKLLENPELLALPGSGQIEEDYKKDKTVNDGPENAVSAYLGPQLWDKTIACDDDFSLEYMDLDEFLTENGFTLDEDVPNINSEKTEKANEKEKPDLSPDSDIRVDFSLSEQDLALASVPGQGMFDPRRRRFSPDELKPQPMIKKSKKCYVPDDLKDEKYWARRFKNNLAAKRSRDARRVKENQIAMRAAFLERENEVLKQSLEQALKENEELKEKLSNYEKI